MRHFSHPAAYAALAGALTAGGLATGGPVYQPVDLQPAGFLSSEATGISGGVVVGLGSRPLVPAPGRAGKPPDPIPQKPEALLWNGSAAGVVPLDPTSPGVGVSSVAWAVAGNQQVGVGPSPAGTSLDPHALLWTGSAASVVDLHPAQFSVPNSTLTGTNGSKQVGWVSSNSLNYRAVLWSGTADSAVLLHPANNLFTYTQANGISPDGNTQVGGALTASASPQFRALMWHNTAASLTDLTPSGAAAAVALAASDKQQAGFATIGAGDHAVVWNGTASSFLDLHPVNFTNSKVQAISGAQAVGYGTFGTLPHALVWSGTPGDVVDLQQFVPAALVSAGFTMSLATGVDAQGNVSGVVTNRQTGISHAFEWVPQGFDSLPAGEGMLLAQATPGDANFDGTVNFADLLRLAQHYGAGGANWSVGDFNNDGMVGFPDLLLLAQHYGTAPAANAAAASVPEPLYVGVVALTVLGLRRRRSG